MKATLVFPIKENKILLAKKMKKIGAGKWNGFGGKPEGEESMREAACRELFEESGSGLKTTPDNLTPCALIDFFFFKNSTEKPDWSVAVYKAHSFEGEASPTPEMDLPTWFSFENVPYSEMLPADKEFLPRVLNGEIFKGLIRFNEDMSGVSESSYLPAELEDLEI